MDTLETNNFIHYFTNNIIPNTINIVFKNLNNYDKNIVNKYFFGLLQTIFFSFRIDYKTFIKKLQDDDYMIPVGVLLLLFPHISGNANEIEKLSDISIVKTDTDKYKYTNLQYGLIDRSLLKEQIFGEDNLKEIFLFLMTTIKKVSSKLFVNWIDIIPYTINDYKTTGLYIDTLNLYQSKQIRSHDFNINIFNKTGHLTDNTILNCVCLPIDDIYDTIANELYYQIKNIKWMVYDVVETNNKRPLPTVVLLNYLFGGNLLFYPITTDWISLSLENKSKFTSGWDRILTLSSTDSEEYSDGYLKISNEQIKKIVSSVCIFFNNYYKNIDTLVNKKKYKQLPESYKLTNIGNDEIKEKIKLSFATISQSLNSIPIEHLYTYFRDSFELFNYTWYSYYLLDDNKQHVKSVDDYYKIELFSKTISPKCIYNFAKSMCHIEVDTEYLMMPRFWVSLTKEQKQLFESHLYTDNTWFDIAGNLRRIGFESYEITKTHELILTNIRKNMIDIVFESLITRGVLSRYIPNPNITFDTPRDKIGSELQKSVLNKTNDIFTYGYYFLTGTPYYITDTIVINGKPDSYFDYMSTRNQWFSAYALNWISQIGFFNRFLNNRVIYVTGSTGVGKSTQIPKLILYGTKAFYHNSTSKIVCTQPRISPTRKTADIVSLEMGVPIDIDVNKNYFIQFKHKGNKHVKNANHLFLRIMTDGSLGMEITNPVLKSEPSLKYNIYDVVIIDEAHEHNANMDMILTLMKYITLYNNTLKLVIVSATMDDDEPIYRRFYRDINDNRKYPLNYWIKDNNMDRVNVDRRVHISPYGRTTNHKISEFYKENGDPIKQILEIIQSTHTGDILLFQPGKKEIAESIDILNKLSPSHVIALPYHSELKDDRRQFIEDISDRLKDLRMNKTDDFNDKPNITKGNGHYTRAVIVATNIAEASITIRTLKFVVETGVQNTAIYSYQHKNTAIEKTTISDSSRLQRRGRVGRVGPGTVYYMYNANKTKDVRTYYNFCIKNINFDLYNRLCEDSTSSISFDINNDPNNPNFTPMYGNIKSIYNEFVPFINSYFNLKTYYDYFGNSKFYDYNNYENITEYRKNGYTLDNLRDIHGKFYIIHPDELSIKRNVTGKIVKHIQTNKLITDGVYNSQKIIEFFNELSDLFIYGDEDNIYKTNIGVKIQLLNNIFELSDPRHLYLLLYSFVFNNTHDMLKLVSLLETQDKYMNIFKPIETLINSNPPKTIYISSLKEVKKYAFDSEIHGDLEMVLRIMDNFHRDIGNSNISDDIKLTKHDINRDLRMAYDVDAYIKKLNIGRMSSDTVINSEKLLEILDSKYNERHINDTINHNLSSIKKTSDKYHLKFEMMKNYLKNYYELHNTFYLYVNKALSSVVNFEHYNYLFDVVKYLKNISKTSVMTNYDKLISCFVLVYPYNIVSNIQGTPHNLYLYDPSISNIYTIKTQKNTTNLITFLDQKYLNGLLFYSTIAIGGDGTGKKEISGINYVHPSLISLLHTTKQIYSIEILDKKYKKEMIKQVIGTTQISSTKYKDKLREVYDYIISKNTIDDTNKLFDKKVFFDKAQRTQKNGVIAMIIGDVDKKEENKSKQRHEFNKRILELHNL